MTGHLRLSRDILEWGWYGDANTRSVFFHLLLTANYEEREYLGHKIKRGEAVIGLNVLAETLGISVRNVRTALKHLKSTNEVTIKTTNKFSIVTICDFEHWQGLDATSDKQTDKQDDKQVTINRQASDTQVTTPEEIKKERIKEIKKISTEGVVASTDPKKKRKKSAISAEEKELRAMAKSLFIEKYKGMFGEEYYWEAKDGANLPKLLAKIKFSRKSKNFPIDDESLLDGFRLFLEHVKKNNFLMNNYTIPTLNSQYNAIMTGQCVRRGELPGQVMRGEEREYNEQNFFEK